MQWMKALLISGTPDAYWAQQHRSPIPCHQAHQHSHHQQAVQQQAPQQLPQQQSQPQQVLRQQQQQQQFVPRPDLGLKSILIDHSLQELQQQQQNTDLEPESSRLPDTDAASASASASAAKGQSSADFGTDLKQAGSSVDPRMHDMRARFKSNQLAYSQDPPLDGLIHPLVGSVQSPTGSLQSQTGLRQSPAGPVKSTAVVAESMLQSQEDSQQFSGSIYGCLEELPRELVACRRILQHSFVLEYFWQGTADQARSVFGFQLIYSVCGCLSGQELWTLKASENMLEASSHGGLNHAGCWRVCKRSWAVLWSSCQCRLRSCQAPIFFSKLHLMSSATNSAACQVSTYSIPIPSSTATLSHPTLAVCVSVSC